MLGAFFRHRELALPLPGLAAFVHRLQGSLHHFNQVLVLVFNHHIHSTQPHSLDQGNRVVLGADQYYRHIPLGAPDTLKNILGGNPGVVLRCYQQVPVAHGDKFLQLFFTAGQFRIHFKISAA